MNSFDCIVIGGGAAGLMCAATAGQRGRSVAILDHANKVGKKILMSGGGRCNFTNYDISPENYLSGNPHFCKSALSRYTQWDFLALVEKYALAYHEKTLGQLFCDNKSKDILQILLAECEKGQVTITTGCDIIAVKSNAQSAYRYHLTTSLGQYQCESLIIASGGLSIPTMGASGFGYKLARQFGLNLLERDASLVPFTFKGKWLELAQSLAGVSVDVNIECRNQSFREALLFTHKGISGPAVLQISNYWHAEDSVSVDFLPNIDLTQHLRQWRDEANKTKLANLLSQWLPKRFITTWIEFFELTALLDKPLAEWSNENIELITNCFKHWQITPFSTEGYRTAEVTRGGVCTSEISSKTFEAHKAPGLYFIGEVLDVTGWLGGYNFQWAWASGYCCGQYA